MEYRRELPLAKFDWCEGRAPEKVRDGFRLMSNSPLAHKNAPPFDPMYVHLPWNSFDPRAYFQASLILTMCRDERNIPFSTRISPIVMSIHPALAGSSFNRTFMCWVGLLFSFAKVWSYLLALLVCGHESPRESSQSRSTTKRPEQFWGKMNRPHAYLLGLAVHCPCPCPVISRERHYILWYTIRNFI